MDKIFNSSEDTSEKSCIYTNNGKVYYAPSGFAFLLNDDNTINIPTVKESGTDSENRGFHRRKII